MKISPPLPLSHNAILIVNSIEYQCLVKVPVSGFTIAGFNGVGVRYEGNLIAPKVFNINVTTKTPSWLKFGNIEGEFIFESIYTSWQWLDSVIGQKFAGNFVPKKGDLNW